MDASPDDLAVYIRKKVLRDMESVGKEAYLYLLARKRNQCDQPRRSSQTGARLVMDSVRPLQPEKKVTGVERAGELRSSMYNQRSCFKCKRYGHIACDCTYPSPVAKKAGTEVIPTARKDCVTKKFCSDRRSCSGGDGQPAE
ncbi:hypothetical protein PoB_006661000 [Plakobranchus ocellatus]|uniref:CCHC-type domain-containing protein n=1 Tax=Plakobranchus ocellatus TaxID=259542 RepID=A0AAV4D7K9_9GAST|nr:hypothetical protein PoB_006661000 [Plakobranchus ocellatus]